MLKTVMARFRKGRIEPLESLQLEEGAELMVMITRVETEGAQDEATTSTAGAWQDLLDCKQFERDVYADRLIRMRPEVRL